MRKRRRLFRFYFVKKSFICFIFREILHRRCYTDTTMLKILFNGLQQRQLCFLIKIKLLDWITLNTLLTFFFYLCYDTEMLRTNTVTSSIYKWNLSYIHLTIAAEIAVCVVLHQHCENANIVFSNTKYMITLNIYLLSTMS